ncbi:SpoIIE family protein phosphatase [Streptomyces griseus]|uniref:SpoIIE family protein phosphatase n=1 Tax=Streptomyces griseus TaxID=1911 RepID=UPI00056B0AB8|nr:SpoIIE family protein phosphatase [Streptomyces griseus]
MGDAERLDDVFGRLVQEVGASVGLLYLLPPEERALRLSLVSGVSARLAAPWARVALDAPVPVADAVRERRLVWLGSREEVARRYPPLQLVLPYDFMLAGVPITDDGTVRGGVVLLWPLWHPPQLSADERDLMDAGCRHLGRLLRQADAGGHPVMADEPRALSPPRLPVEERVDAAAAVEFTERLPMGCCALDLDGRITFANTAAADLLGTGAASLLGARPWEVLLWLRDPAFEDRYRAAVIGRRPTAFTALRPPDTRLSFQLYPDASGISVHITPAPADQPLTAVPEMLPTPGDPAGATAHYHLTHLAAALAEAVGARDVVELVADQIVPAFGAQALALMTAEEGRLHIVGHRNYPADLLARFDAEPLTSDTPAARVATTGHPSFFGTFADLERAYPPAVHQDDMGAWAFLPLIASGHIVGSMVLAYDRPRAFPTAERAILTSLAGLIAQALDRARLYDAKDELARTLQAGLLPHALPRIPGLDVAARYLPAGRGMGIGGDFYDLFGGPASTAVAAIGDVQGHNVTAAALMGQVRTAVHAHATAGASPGNVLARTNRLLTDLEPGLFTSCLCVHLDLVRHRASLATAGHPPPLLRHPDGRTEVLDLSPGLLLGIDPAADYTTSGIELPPGSVLALYTDGLVETPGVDIDEATADLAALLAWVPEDAADGVFRNAGSASNSAMESLADLLVQPAGHIASRPDDIALLLLNPLD